MCPMVRIASALELEGCAQLRQGPENTQRLTALQFTVVLECKGPAQTRNGRADLHPDTARALARLLGDICRLVD